MIDNLSYALFNQFLSIVVIVKVESEVGGEQVGNVFGVEKIFVVDSIFLLNLHDLEPQFHLCFWAIYEGKVQCFEVGSYVVGVDDGAENGVIIGTGITQNESLHFALMKQLTDIFHVIEKSRHYIIASYKAKQY